MRNLKESRRRWNCGRGNICEWTYEGGTNADFLSVATDARVLQALHARRMKYAKRRAAMLSNWVAPRIMFIRPKR